MVLETIHVVRHGFRSNWSVDPSTGEYASTVPSPTGIVADPALAGYGVKQAQQLGQHLLALDPPIDLIYSSPFYRCLQTLSPFVTAHAKDRVKTEDVVVHVEPGLGEFYGLARFDHPSPAGMDELHNHFDHLTPVSPPTIIPSTKGESITQLHDRVAYCLQCIIARADADPRSPKTLLICTHAAVMIAIGRALTGRMPVDEGEDDFRCFTCSFSSFVRRKTLRHMSAHAAEWTADVPEQVPQVGWRDGIGVGGGWDCRVNADCSFLDGGEERGWHFSGDESFINDPNAFNNAASNAKESKNGTDADTLCNDIGTGQNDINGKSRL